jgi:muconolactone D-isomerase
MEFLVDFEINVPERTPAAEVKDRQAEAAAAAKLQNEEHLVRVGKRPLPTGETSVLGLYRAGSETELEGLLSGLPLYEWMKVTITALKPHPNDPAAAQATSAPAGASRS